METMRRTGIELLANAEHTARDGALARERKSLRETDRPSAS